MSKHIIIKHKLLIFLFIPLVLFILLFIFTRLDSWTSIYSKDRNHVYCFGRLLPKVNPNTFTYRRLKNNDYEFEGSDGRYEFGDCQGSINPKASIDIKCNSCQTKTITAEKAKGYLKIDNKLIWCGVADNSLYEEPTCEEMIWVRNYDIDTLVANENWYWYAKDKNNVYYKGQILEGANPKNFKVVGGCGTDNEHVYCNGEILKDADSKTFKVVNDSYFKDKYHVYCSDNYNIKMIKNADPKTFKIMFNGSRHEAEDVDNFYDRCNVTKKTSDPN